jgi:hypothetical protein
MTELGRKGGLAGAESRKPKVVLPDDVPSPMKTAEDITKWASWLAYSIATGKIDPKTAHEISIAITQFRAGHDYSEGQAKAREAKKLIADMKKEQQQRGDKGRSR